MRLLLLWFRFVMIIFLVICIIYLFIFKYREFPKNVGFAFVAVLVTNELRRIFMTSSPSSTTEPTPGNSNKKKNK